MERTNKQTDGEIDILTLEYSLCSKSTRINIIEITKLYTKYRTFHFDVFLWLLGLKLLMKKVKKIGRCFNLMHLDSGVSQKGASQFFDAPPGLAIKYIA